LVFTDRIVIAEGVATSVPPPSDDDESSSPLDDPTISVSTAETLIGPPLPFLTAFISRQSRFSPNQCLSDTMLVRIPDGNGSMLMCEED
jgi:hypothetical protein